MATRTVIVSIQTKIGKQAFQIWAIPAEGNAGKTRRCVLCRQTFRGQHNVYGMGWESVPHHKHTTMRACPEHEETLRNLILELLGKDITRPIHTVPNWINLRKFVDSRMRRIHALRWGEPWIEK